ncbi:MAG: cytochrome c1 [Gammaproteobacteria bacterium]|nr:MAG: cytochrome c1 [Gammaproteobacteria bacterium]
MRKRVASVLLLLAPVVALAGGDGDVKLDKVSIDLSDQASLQRGARMFVNYCLSCHSAAYMRYNRMGRDLGLTDELVKENLLFAADKVGDLMKAVMPAEDAKAAFNTVPPDLTVIARSRGADWFYTYMRSFYRDEAAVSGWNNVIFPAVAMPHVLYAWQGEKRAIYEDDGYGGRKVAALETAKAGSMSDEEFDSAMRDLTNFMVYMGEPAKLVRYKIGVYVILFLLIFMIPAYAMKKEFWKDIH